MNSFFGKKYQPICTRMDYSLLAIDSLACFIACFIYLQCDRVIG